MKPTHHAIISAGVGTAFGFWAQSLAAGGVCFLSGIFIDIDHVIDYVIFRKKFPDSYQDLYDFGYKEDKAKLFLFFHSYELFLLLWILVFCVKMEPIWLGFAVGLTGHMICDQFVNPVRPLGYFLFFRLKQNFERRKILTDAFYKKYS